MDCTDMVVHFAFPFPRISRFPLFSFPTPLSDAVFRLVFLDADANADDDAVLLLWFSQYTTTIRFIARLADDPFCGKSP